ncbi:MAG: 5-carboxymethyl-2-hydroxymuconate semialdehyde dehydrogenase [Bacteroidota bacterium]
MLQQNLQILAKVLADLPPQGLSNFINGQWVEAQSGATFVNHSPVDGQAICTVAASAAPDVAAAAEAAQQSFGQWKNWSHQNRKAILYRIAEEIEKHSEVLAILESYDTGQAIRYTKHHVSRALGYFRYYADRSVDAQNGQSTPDVAHLNYTIRQPIGPVGVITPWNTPLLLTLAKIVPALVAGCTVVHKPAEWSPLTAHFLVECAHRAGLPAGVWNVVQGMGEVAGKALTEHAAIRAIAFVGESTTGSQIIRQGATTLKRVHFELGGKNPVLVFPDADLDRALDAVLLMKYSLNGQRCTSSSRLILHESVYAPFLAQLQKRVAQLRVGHPLDPLTEIGPLIHPQHQQKVKHYLQLGQAEGARLLSSRQLPAADLSPKTYIAPILFADVQPHMQIAQAEIFGPFLTVLPFSNEAQAIEIANGVKYGLTAYIWTKDIARAHRMARDIESGMVWINSQNVRHPSVPFGGVKYSGLGRDGGDYGLHFFMETKNITVALGDHPIPQLGKTDA